MLCVQELTRAFLKAHVSESPCYPHATQDGFFYLHHPLPDAGVKEGAEHLQKPAVQRCPAG